MMYHENVHDGIVPMLHVTEALRKCLFAGHTLLKPDRCNSFTAFSASVCAKNDDTCIFFHY